MGVKGSDQSVKNFTDFYIFFIEGFPKIIGYLIIENTILNISLMTDTNLNICRTQRDKNNLL